MWHSAQLFAVRPTGTARISGEDEPITPKIQYIRGGAEANEDGVPNHNPDGTGVVDNHDILTATNASGNFDGGSSCSDWTSTAAAGGGGGFGGSGPRIGHSWGARSGRSWMNAHTARGCGAGINLSNQMGNQSTVGAMGGYGGIYCFAMKP